MTSLINSTNVTSLLIINNKTDFLASIHLVVNYLDYAVRVYAVLVHLVYIFFIYYLKEFRNRTLVLLHHVNIVSFIYCLLFLFYIGSRFPSFSNKLIDDILCTMSEIVWAVVKLMRISSLLSLSLYRYLAVYHVHFYKFLNNNYLYLIQFIVIIWVVSISISIALKYLFQTTYSMYFCTDGYSTHLDYLIGYFVVVILINLIFTVVIVALYIKILKKFKLLSDKVKNKGNQISPLSEPTANTNNNDNQSNIKPNNILSTQIIPIKLTGFLRRKRRNNDAKQEKFARQFIFLNLCVIISTVLAMMVNFMMVIAENPQFSSLDLQLEELRPILRILFLLFQSCIPLMSLIFNPWSFNFSKLFVFWKLARNYSF